jgi:hypothetical protein
MQCPLCQDRGHIAVGLNDGSLACGIIKECDNCGAVWSKTNQEVSMISVPKRTYVVERTTIW